MSKDGKTADTAPASVTAAKTASPTFMKVRNTANRPLEIIFSDGGSALRIGAKETAYIDEQRLAHSIFAQKQVEDYVKKNNLRILAKNAKKEV